MPIPQADNFPIDPLIGASFEGGKLTIEMNGNFVRVETDFGLAVENDGVWTALIRFPLDFADVTEGLCGNNDGDPNNDMTTSDGVDVTGEVDSYSQLADSWEVTG